MEKQYKLKCLEGDEPRIKISKRYGFIQSNNLELVRTEEEILKRIEDSDMFDFAPEVLADYLSWEKAKQFYKDEYVKKVDSGDKKYEKITDISEATQDFLDYMVFGWMKAMDERGISAGRTVRKLGHWLWLMNRDDLRRIIDDGELYNPYGSPALIAVCEEMGIKVPDNLREFSKHKDER